jgi:hypothetical protein
MVSVDETRKDDIGPYIYRDRHYDMYILPEYSRSKPTKKTRREMKDEERQLCQIPFVVKGLLLRKEVLLQSFLFPEEEMPVTQKIYEIQKRRQKECVLQEKPGR